jgi:hypothetical protein
VAVLALVLAGQLHPARRVGQHPAVGHRLVYAIRTVLRISERRSKLLGLDAPARVEVEGIPEQEFAEMACELLELTGIRPLVEAALPALEPAERAAWLRAADGTADDADEDIEGWSNLGPQHELLYATQHPAPDTAPAEDWPAGEPAGADDDQGDDAKEIGIDAEVVEPGNDEAEVIVPMPGGFTSVRRVPAAAVCGRRIDPYDPLAAWRPGQTRHRDRGSRLKASERRTRGSQSTADLARGPITMKIHMPGCAAAALHASGTANCTISLW